jgi:long-chain acyl-CoA synthetase
MNKIETVFESIGKHAKNSPDKTAIIAGRESITYQALATRVNMIANSLHALEVAAGARVGVATVNVIDHLIGSLGAMAAGAIPVALPNTDNTSYRAIVEDASPALIINEGGRFDLLDASGNLSETRSIEDLQGKVDAPLVNFLGRQVEPEEIAMIYYTSGTSSGVRKGVMQSYRALHNTADYIVEITQLNDEVREFVASSIDNAFWFGRCRCILKVGGTILLHDGTLNPLAIIDSIKRNEGNAISGDTPVYLLLMNYLEKNFLQIAPMIRWAKIASQAMPVKDKERLIKMLPNARIVMGYGLTEAMRTSLLSFNDFPDKLASDGRACPGVSVAIVNAQGEIGVPPKDVGEVLISGGNLASGYWNKGRMWEEKLIGKWYKSGDLGYLDEDGYLFLLGRKDHAINSGGKTIALSEVENRLRPHISAASFAACGMKDPKGILGEVVVLCIEGDWAEKTDWKDLRIHLFECMEPALVPKEAYCIPQFPRTSNGKIQLGILREKIEQGAFNKC